MKPKFLMLTLAAFLTLAMACSKSHSPAGIDTGTVPHKEVPEPFIGDYSWTQVSSSGYNDAYGGAYSSLTIGSSMHLNKNGTGFFVFRYDINYPNGAHKSVHIDSDVAYEITKTSESTVDVLIHFIRGKNYEDNVFLHDLDASKIYPNGDFVWTGCQFGVDDMGTSYFQHDQDNRYLKN